tara:strand:+ start:135 stop:626 length:492 start_codon:yes stop_codon:yes gene_type:complete
MKITKSLLRKIIKEQYDSFEAARDADRERNPQGFFDPGSRSPEDDAREAAEQEEFEATLPRHHKPFAETNPDMPPGSELQSITQGGAEQDMMDQADLDVANTRNLAQAKREWARARYDIRQFLKKGGGEYESIYDIPRDGSPAGRARQRFAAAYTRYKRLKRG